MRREPWKYLWDAREAARAVHEFVSGKSRDDYARDLLLRSGVERQLEIVGEALNQLAKHDPGLAGEIPDLPAIVGFRNVLVHGYALVNDDRVWDIVHESLPELLTKLEALLGPDHGRSDQERS